MRSKNRLFSNVTMASTCSKANAQENDEASTSKFESELEITMETLGKMIIGCKRYQRDEQTAEDDDEIRVSYFCLASSIIMEIHEIF